MQVALHRSRTDVEVAGDVFHTRAAAGEFTLDCSPHALDEAVLTFMLFQLFVELRREHREQFSVAGYKG